MQITPHLAGMQQKQLSAGVTSSNLVRISDESVSSLGLGFLGFESKDYFFVNVNLAVHPHNYKYEKPTFIKLFIIIADSKNV